MVIEKTRCQNPVEENPPSSAGQPLSPLIVAELQRQPGQSQAQERNDHDRVGHPMEARNAYTRPRWESAPGATVVAHIDQAAQNQNREWIPKTPNTTMMNVSTPR